MDKQQLFYLSVLALVIILVSVSIIALDYFDPYKFRVEQQGVLFKSKTMPPANLLSEAAAQNAFLLMPEFRENSGVNSYTGQAWILFRTVLAANGKEAESLLRAYNKEGRLLKCQFDSKSGDNKEISAQECDSMLASSKVVKVYLEFPAPGLPPPEVVVEPGSLTVRPKVAGDVSPVSKVLLAFLYPNTDEIISKSNALLGQLQNKRKG